MDDILERLLAPRAKDRFAEASDVQVRLVRLRREIEKLAKGDVHAATTNPGGTPQELIDQITGAIDESTVAPQTDPQLPDVPDSEPAHAHLETRQERRLSPAPAPAFSATEPAPTSPPSRPLPPPSRAVAYVDDQHDSFIRATQAARILEQEEAARPRASSRPGPSPASRPSSPPAPRLRRELEAPRRRFPRQRIYLVLLRETILDPLRAGKLPTPVIFAIVVLILALLAANGRTWLR